MGTWRLQVPEQQAGGAPPPFVFHGDEWLLTPLNKGIISRLRLRGWTRTETGNKSPGSCSTPNYATKA